MPTMQDNVQRVPYYTARTDERSVCSLHERQSRSVPHLGGFCPFSCHPSLRSPPNVAFSCLARFPPAFSFASAHCTGTQGRNASVTGQLQRLVRGSQPVQEPHSISAPLYPFAYLDAHNQSSSILNLSSNFLKIMNLICELMKQLLHLEIVLLQAERTFPCHNI